MISKKRKISVAVMTFIFICLFALSAKGVFAAIDEEEPNDDRTTANTIEMGETVYGDTPIVDKGNYSSNDDYFKFTAPISGTAKLSVWTDSVTEDESDGLQVYVYDRNDNRIGKVFDSYRSESCTSITFPVQCGKTYYLECYGSDGVIGIYTNVSYHLRVDYSIGKTSIKSVKGKSKAFTVNWNKKAKASFYQVQYVKKSTYDDYGWTGAKKINVSSQLGSKTVQNLMKKKTYYVRVRVARTIEGVTYYSPWSSKQKVQTK